MNRLLRRGGVNFPLDISALKCYHGRAKSVDGEKYRPSTAQRARRLLQAGTAGERERTPKSCKLKPGRGVGAPAAGRYSGSVSKVNVYGKSDRMLWLAYGKLGGTADQDSDSS